MNVLYTIIAVMFTIIVGLVYVGQWYIKKLTKEVYVKGYNAGCSMLHHNIKEKINEARRGTNNSRDIKFVEVACPNLKFETVDKELDLVYYVTRNLKDMWEETL